MKCGTIRRSLGGRRIGFGDFDYTMVRMYTQLDVHIYIYIYMTWMTEVTDLTRCTYRM